MAVAATKLALAHLAFSGEWKFLTIGPRGRLPPIPLSKGHILREAPWQNLADYAALLQISWNCETMDCSMRRTS